MSPRLRTGYIRLVLGLTLYLSLFSAFALYHAYANNELVDTHGCPIGEWVLHAQSTVVAVALVAVVFAPLLCVMPMAPRVRPAPRHGTVWMRGPPRMALL